MWMLFVVAVFLSTFSRVEAALHLDFHGADGAFPRSLKSFWHLNNRGRTMERVFNDLNVKRPQRAVVAVEVPDTPLSVAEQQQEGSEWTPCVCHYLYFSTTYCFGDCDSS
ncbi:hypothetical protein Aduo_014080 [Ancylostoma duodenale]